MSRHRRLVAAALVAIAAAVLIARLWASMGPWASGAGGFHSDTAMPVLQSNGGAGGLFELYAWGQDRFGAWPFFVARAFAMLRGTVADVATVFGLQLAFLVATLTAAAWLVRSQGLLLAAALAAGCVANGFVRTFLFDISQPYAWQLGTFVLGAAAFRRWSEHRLGSQASRPPLLWLATFALATVLSVWMSPLSTPLFALLVVAELVRHRLGACARGGALAWLALAGVAPLVAAVAGDRVVRHYLYVQNQERYNWPYKLGGAIDFGFLKENLAALWSASGFGGPLLVTLAAACVVAVVATTRARAWTAHRAALLTTAGGAVLGAIGLFAVSVLISWVRANGYAPRYLAPAQFLVMLAAAALLVYVVDVLPALQRPLVAGGLAASLLLAAASVVPTPVPSPLADMKALARALVAESGGRPAVLLGDYWSTYLVAAADPAAGVIPVVVEGQHNRTPWTPRVLKDTETLFVAHRGYGRSGPPQAPAKYLLEHGSWFRLDEARVLQSGDLVLSRYRNVAGLRVPATFATGPLPGDTVAGAGTAPGSAADARSGTTIDLSGRTNGADIVVVLWNTDSPASAPVAEAFAAAGTPCTAALESWPGSFLVNATSCPEGAARVRLSVAGTPPWAPHVREAAVFPRGAP